jgi:AraC-like DNA-binding protein
VQETNDPCHWERASQPWEVLAMPIGTAPFRNHKIFLATPNCILYQESFDSRVRARALSPEGMFVLAVPVRWSSRTSYFRQPLQERGLPVMLPGSAEAVYDAGDQQFMLLIRLTLLRHLLPAEQAAGLAAAVREHCLAASAVLIKRLGRWLQGILRRTHEAPEMLRHRAAVQTLERELVLGLAGLLDLPRADELSGRNSLRGRGFERAVDHIRHADLSTLDLAALCAAAGVSQRTLEYGFHEHLGLSPMAFIRQLRMHALRRELLAARLGEASVTELAYHLGFTQLGRLAGDYRRTFGELPSETLSRPMGDEAPPFWIGAVGSRAPGGTAAWR